MDNFLVVGLAKSARGEAIHLSNGEFGADLDVLSTDQCGRGTSMTGSSFPSLDGVFEGRWIEESGGCSQYPGPGPLWCVEYSFNGKSDCIRPNVGVDWSGNMAMTSHQGRMSAYKTDIYGDLSLYGHRDVAVLAQDHQPVDDISDAHYFSSGYMPGNPFGKLPTDRKAKKGDGIAKDVDLSDLENEIEEWMDMIPTYDAEGFISQDIENHNKMDASGPFIIELLAAGETSAGGAQLSFLDTNGDGIIIIDVNRGSVGSPDDWKINNSDVIIVGSSSVTAIFRLMHGSNMLVDHSSIQRPGEHATVLFAIAVEEERRSRDVVMKGSNSVFDGVAFWEIAEGVSDNGWSEMEFSNCQGCSQFVGDQISFDGGRFTRCAFGVASY